MGVVVSRDFRVSEASWASSVQLKAVVSSLALWTGQAISAKFLTYRR